MKENRPLRTAAAFSLIELLSVMAIMAIVVALTMPAISGTIVGTRISTAAQVIVGEINFARATAMSRNMPVEVCFLQITSPDSPQPSFRAVQSRLLAADGTNSWLSRIKRLPEGISISSSASHSPPLGVSPYDIEDTAADVVQGVVMRIYPSGLVEPVDQNGDAVGGQAQLFVTVGQTLRMEGNTLPANFITVQVNPRTGRTTTHQP